MAYIFHHFWSLFVCCAADTAEADLKLKIPSDTEKVKLHEEDEERMYSPPVTKDEMTSDDLLSVHEMSGVWG